jgi:hypothetical protein
VITSDELQYVLRQGLKCRRNVFHSEADLQHELALELHRAFPDHQFRLERPWDGLDRRIYIDLWVEDPEGGVTVIELKYKTSALSLKSYYDEEFVLRDQRAQDDGCYHFIRDIWRLEQLDSQINTFAGFALMLSNDAAYWAPPNGAFHDAFRLTPGRMLEGRLAWSEDAADGLNDRVIELNGRYSVEWRYFAELCHGPNCQLDFCLIEVSQRKRDEDRASREESERSWSERHGR